MCESKYKPVRNCPAGRHAPATYLPLSRRPAAAGPRHGCTFGRTRLRTAWRVALMHIMDTDGPRAFSATRNNAHASAHSRSSSAGGRCVPHLPRSPATTPFPAFPSPPQPRMPFCILFVQVTVTNPPQSMFKPPVSGTCRKGCTVHRPHLAWLIRAHPHLYPHTPTPTPGRVCLPASICTSTTLPHIHCPRNSRVHLALPRLPHPALSAPLLARNMLRARPYSR